MATPTSSATTSPTTTCISGLTPDKNGYVPPEACNANFAYYPSFAAAIIFSVIFGLALTLHLIQGITYRKKFTWVICMGAAWELASFIIRTISTKHQQNSSFVTISTILFLLAPLWINAFDYMVLGRMVHYFIPEQKLFHVKATRFSVYFVWLDVISFLVQLGGGLLLSGTNQPAHLLALGKDIYMGGIGMQQLFILFFLGMVISFHRRMLALEVEGKLYETGKEKWRGLVYALYASLLLITIRIIYRLIEFSRGTGSNNPIPYHEAYMYALDALPMSLALFVMVVCHPGRSLVGPDSEFPKGPTRKEKKAAKKARKAEKLELANAKKNGGVGSSEDFLVQPPTDDENQHSNGWHEGQRRFEGVRAWEQAV